MTLPPALSTLAALSDKGLVGELTGRKKNRVFAYTGDLDVLNRGTELGEPDVNSGAGATASRRSGRNPR